MLKHQTRKCINSTRDCIMMSIDFFRLSDYFARGMKWYISGLYLISSSMYLWFALMCIKVAPFSMGMLSTLFSGKRTTFTKCIMRIFALKSVNIRIKKGHKQKAVFVLSIK